jgi:pilus assembly protein Flp/PilA
MFGGVQMRRRPPDGASTTTWVKELKMTTLFSRFVKDGSGATAIEYGLIAGGIAVVIITAVGLVGNNLSNAFNNIATNVR